MKTRLRWIVLVFMGLLLLTLTCQKANATVVNNTYYFSESYESSHREDLGPLYQSISTSQYRVTVYNLTEHHGDDVYEYNYQGLIYGMWIDSNHTVEFQDNKVHFDLYTYDSNGNNRSEATFLTLFPSPDYSTSGRQYFVNPIWTTHTNEWNEAKEDVSDDPTVNHYLTSFTNTENGRFSFTIIVNVEGYVGGENEDANGTRTFTLDSLYDSDGILMNWRLSQRYWLVNENHTLDWIDTDSIIRATSVGPEPNPLFSYLQTILITTGIALPIGVLIGLLVVKKGWVRT
ncbi:MAG: hypothetical protein ACFFDP_12210 [Promethearchaeota archaeon]